MTLSELAEKFYLRERPVGTVLELDTVLAQAITAARKYAAFGVIESLLPEIGAVNPPVLASTEARYPISYYPPAEAYAVAPVVPGSPLEPVGWITEETVISQSEWAVIHPLFLLYVERENAVHLEASRTMGVDVYGRSSSEVSTEIMQLEADLPRAAFMQPVISV